jgi:hypothetical protein
MPPAPKKKTTKSARGNSAPTASRTRNTATDSSPPTTRKTAARKAKETTVPDDQETVTLEKDTEDLATTVAALKNHATESQDAVDEIRAQLQHYGTDIHELGSQVRTLVEALQKSVPGITTAPSTTPTTVPPQIGTNPLSFIEQHLAWLDSNLVTSIVSHKLDPKELILLLPVEERPTKRGTLRSNIIQFDQTTGTLSTVDDARTTFEKDFPSIEYLTYALSVYGAVRGLYDVDNTGIGPAIFLHIKRIARDVAVCKYEWKSIVAYVISHFRKYQKSSNPLDWINTDSELFLTHIKASYNPTAAPRSPAKAQQPQAQPSRLPRPSNEVCINWNTYDKGCSWSTCSRKHVCLECKAPDHKSYSCPTRKGKALPKSETIKGDKP